MEEKLGGDCQIKQETEKNRVVSVTDLEVRHERKSASKLFNRHKEAVAADMKSQPGGGVEVLAGNAEDQRNHWI